MSDRLYKVLREADNIFKAPGQDELIRRWADEHELTRNSDGSFSSDGTMYPYSLDPIIKKGKFTIKFGEARSFDCNRCRLVSLVGSPRKIIDFFDCSHNSIKNLDGAPKEVGGDFYIVANRGRTFTESEVRAVCDVKGHVYV